MDVHRLSSYLNIPERWETASRGLWDSKNPIFQINHFLTTSYHDIILLYVSCIDDAYENSYLWPGYAHLHQCNHCTSSISTVCLEVPCLCALISHINISFNLKLHWASGLFFSLEITQWYNISYLNCPRLGMNHVS